jgi:hypothetical protein
MEEDEMGGASIVHGGETRNAYQILAGKHHL